jgi:maleamate amidohydrolase
MSKSISGGADDIDVYARQGFGQKSGIGARPAVIVVDFTNAFVDPALFGGGNIAAAVAATARLLEAARRAGWPIAYSRVVHAADGSDAGPFARKVPALLTQVEDDPASAIVDDLAPHAGDLVVRKTAPSAFFGTGLAPWLAFNRVDSVIVTGATTSGCVRASVVDAMSHGYLVVVPRDCVGDRAEGPHEANLFDIAQKYADVVESATLIALAERSQRPT